MFRKRLLKLIVVLMFVALTSLPAGARQATDQLGRKVVLSDDPQRVVSLAPSITEIIFALGQEHRLKGVTRYSDFPPEAVNLPRVGSYVQLDLERIVALKPELCIAIKDGNPREIVERLESLGIPVYAVDPRNLEAVMETILEIGKLLDASEAAKALVADMQYRIQQVRFRAAKASHRPRVFYQVGIFPIVSVGTNTFIHELIVSAGGDNLTEGPIPYPRFSREQVLVLSPEVLIISSMARGEVFERVKTEWSRWSELPAIKNQRIFLVDSSLFDRPTPRLVDGLELLGRLIHPELLEE
ncbi:MAG: cobalamin-binding protein [Proteobacteria bacterium]|nr:cobalamin-binding protein [Pseudomonadota bacterium]MBU4260136.1 cobalamin-binding protein [Pseudomonadota bacterium]MBU4287121.1 cobalamin-binding protein [Pseudomonadota bacterium]MBU4413862.1 cobalamin-binding protein [Pseudomonadota bacterium]MCG2759031.1 cobalamin-binding protein [Desulfobacteraceae bacterium]